jgi:sugar phosphate isomerase/epimerase
MNTYLSTTFVDGRGPVTAVLKELRAHGVTCVELGSTHTYEEDLKRRLTEEFGDFSFLTHNFFPPPIAAEMVINFSDPRAEVREASIQLTAENVLFAEEIGSRVHTIHPGFLALARVRPAADRNFDFAFENSPDSDTPKIGFERMIESLDRLAERIPTDHVPIAIESQGSISHSEQCLMQTAAEFLELFGSVSSKRIGINVNLGHLNLAAKVFGFDRLAFIDRLSPHIQAFELSHNDGAGDQHLLLQREGWYWDVIRDPRFSNTPMILEVRDASIEAVCENLTLIQNERDAVRISTV